MKKYICLIVFSLLTKEVLLLKNVQITVPQNKTEGQSVQLECDYDLESDTLYSVIWYRGHEQFYAYRAYDELPKHVFETEGIKVDLPTLQTKNISQEDRLQLSDDKKVVLNPVTLKSTGLYRCEVTTDAPNFDSAVSSGRLEIIYSPDGVEYIYLNWTSQSYPASSISWNLDGKKDSDPEPLVSLNPSKQFSFGLVSTSLRLLIPSGKSVQVRCTARPVTERLRRSEAVVWSNSITDSKGVVYLKSSASAFTLSGTLLVFLFALLVATLKK